MAIPRALSGKKVYSDSTLTHNKLLQSPFSLQSQNDTSRIVLFVKLERAVRQNVAPQKCIKAKCMRFFGEPHASFGVLVL